MEGSRSRFPATTPNSTQVSTVYERLREDLLSANLAPGRKLPMRFLMEKYATGQTPLREALNRLTADGLVEAKDQRGFSVSSISPMELAELTKTRCWVEGLALREAMANASPEWEEDLILAHHRLARTHRSLSPETFVDNPEWERLHRKFHRALIVRCGSNSLVAFCEQLRDQLYRYRRLSIARAFRWREVGKEHRAILDAVLEGETEQAVALLVEHYTLTADVILSDGTVFPERGEQAPDSGGE
jgi:DNA-binding GntR family transcriptional regulator